MHSLCETNCITVALAWCAGLQVLVLCKTQHALCTKAGAETQLVGRRKGMTVARCALQLTLKKCSMVFFFSALSLHGTTGTCRTHATTGADTELDRWLPDAELVFPSELSGLRHTVIKPRREPTQGPCARISFGHVKRLFVASQQRGVAYLLEDLELANSSALNFWRPTAKSSVNLNTEITLKESASCSIDLEMGKLLVLRHEGARDSS